MYNAAVKPLIGIVMGSTSDWETLKAAADTLERFGVAYEARVVSAHRTPDLLFEYAESARGRGLRVVIAGAGGAAHLPGMTEERYGEQRGADQRISVGQGLVDGARKPHRGGLSPCRPR